MKETIAFLAELERNNNRDWFEANRKTYESAKKKLSALVQQVIDGIQMFDPELGEQIPSKCMFRINRDVRFSNNKNPYKNNMGAYMAKGGKKSAYGGYYLHVQPNSSFIGAGIWMPEAPILKSIRQELHYNHAAFRKILNAKSFKSHFGEMGGEQLKTSPKGFDADHPAIDLLRYKGFVVSHSFTDKEVCAVDFGQQVIEQFKHAAPFLHYLNNAVDLGLES
jgi:uncharacterized protein (TIGR02453 family)